MIITLMLLFAAGTAEEVATTPEARGQELYRVYCVACHGNSGRGDGPTAAVLDSKPTDLTRLASAAGGTFPAERVRTSIDGREAPVDHRREMPRWGFALQDLSSDANQEESVRLQIDALVAYLRSIQRAP